MIRKVANEFVISSKGVWIPGVYDTERAAKYAFRFDNITLQKLQDEANRRAGPQGGAITFEDLQAAAAELKIDKE